MKPAFAFSFYSPAFFRFSGMGIHRPLTEFFPLAISVPRLSVFPSN
jgi:hypothetical protein